MIRIRKLLNRAIALNGNKVVLSCLNTLLEEENPSANARTLVDARQYALDEKIRLENISNEEATLEQAQINAALQSLVNSLDESDLKEEESRTMDYLIDVIELLDEGQRREEEERREAEEERRKRRAKRRPLNYMAMIGLGVLAFAAGLFLSKPILDRPAVREAISCEEIEAEVNRLKELNEEYGDSILVVNERIKNCNETVAFQKEENGNLRAGADNSTDVSSYQVRIDNLESKLESKTTDLATCEGKLASAEAKLPCPTCPNPLTNLEIVRLHCKTASWENGLGKRIKDKLLSEGHNVERVPPGVGEYAIEYKSGHNTAKKLAHALLKYLENDYCLRKVNTFSNPKEIHIYIP